ncbi:MAG: aminotransferase class I/II-fold pyridoxal phosphate-dependent enzyme [Planctomycetota bacterium]
MNLEELFKPFSPPETNLLERLRYWSVAMPERTAFRYLDGGEEVADSLTYAQLDKKARAIAAHLVARGFAGKSAIMLYQPGLEFITAFFGCHYAGVIPIPAYPPRRNRNMGRISAISINAEASVALTTTSIVKRCEGTLDQAPGLQKIPWIATETIPDEYADDWVKPTIRPDDVGLIQYTSGSTGTPKGVMLTHENLLANCRLIARAFQIKPVVARACSWLPLYHDMGLVGGILNPLYSGIEETLMSPIAFLTRPIRWLRAISRFRGTASGGPNFAFALCTMKIKEEECEGLDLSCWDVAFNGAEPVRADVMRKFAEKFEPYGFRYQAFYPCYGMAETTLIVTGGSQKQEPIVRWFDKDGIGEHRVVPVSPDHKHAKPLVGSGAVIEEEEVLIVHPETRRPLTDDQIGEIWINSPSCGKGYWRREKETEETFRARLNPDNGKYYVRSGDLGFMDNGEVFIAGRLKDMIIVRGVNRYPQDIESTVEQCHPLTRSGGAAAFAFTRWDREHLVIFCEIERCQVVEDNQAVIDAIRASVTDEHELPPDAIVLVRAYSVPKTSSGKVQRHACKEQFENGSESHVIARWSAWEDSPVENEADVTDPALIIPSIEMDDCELSTVVVNAVVHYVKEVGEDRAREVNLDTNIIHLGLDSLERLDVAESLQVHFGGRIPDEVLQEVATVREVAAAIEKYIGTEPVGKGSLNGKPKSAAKPKGPIPESYYVLEKMPEFLRLQSMQQDIAATGIRNPFFSVHEGRISDTTMIDGRELISYASYNYLGLSGHPDVATAAKEAIDEFGTSVSASRIVSGEKTIHKQLEQELAEFIGVEDVMTFPGGHACNESVIGHLVGPGDLIIHDSFAHNSIVQGAELSGARRRPFEHNNWQELNRTLKNIRGDYRRVLIAVEGLYSMDGDYPDLQRFIDVKNKHHAWLYVDEAHSIGTLGETGRGLGELAEVDRRDVELWMGTLSKSFGSCGGYVGGKRALIEYLRYTTPGYVFAAGMPPANVGAALGSLRVLKKNPGLVKKLLSNAQLFLKLANEAGIDTGMAQGTAIVPIMTGHSMKALRLSEALFHKGINAQPILYPAVPEKETRVRIFMTAAHTEQQIRESVAVIAREWHRIQSNGELKTFRAVEADKADQHGAVKKSDTDLAAS